MTLVDAECCCVRVDELSDGPLRGDRRVALSKMHSRRGGQLGAASLRRSPRRVCHWMGTPLAVGNQLGSPDMAAEAVPAGRALINEQAAVLDTRERPTRPPEQLPASTIVPQAPWAVTGEPAPGPREGSIERAGAGPKPKSGAVEACQRHQVQSLDRDAGRRVQLGRFGLS